MNKQNLTSFKTDFFSFLKLMPCFRYFFTFNNMKCFDSVYVTCLIVSECPAFYPATNLELEKKINRSDSSTECIENPNQVRLC